MKRQVNLPMPVVKALRKLGQDISDARRRRRITLQLMAERANRSKNTILKIEKGDPSISMGGYASGLFVIGMTERLSDLADRPGHKADSSGSMERKPSNNHHDGHDHECG